MNKISINIAAALAATITSAAGATGDAPTQHYTSAELVASNAAARGGLEAWRSVKTLALSGTMDVTPPVDPKAPKGSAAPKHIVVPFAMALKRPHKMRLELRFSDAIAAQVFDGTKGYTLHQERGQWVSEPFSDSQNSVAADQQDLDGPLMGAEAEGSKVVFEADEPVEGRPAHRLKVTYADGVSRHVWIDAETYLDVKMDGVRQIAGKLRPAEIYFRDYQSIQGLQIPHVVETRAPGISGSELVRVQVALINTEVGDERFSKPPNTFVPAASVKGKSSGDTKGEKPAVKVPSAHANASRSSP